MKDIFVLIVWGGDSQQKTNVVWILRSAKVKKHLEKRFRSFDTMT